jgi:hypothetical protein
MASATKPDVQVTALMHLAESYEAFDHKKSVEYFRQAFTAASQPPESSSPFARGFLVDIVAELAPIDPNAGIELLKLIPSVGYDYGVSRPAA